MIDVSGKNMLSSIELLEYFATRQEVSWNYENERQLNWRLSKPNGRYKLEKGLITKNYGGLTNVLHLAERGFGVLNEDQSYRILIPSPLLSYLPEYKKQFDYHFGIRNLGTNFEVGCIKNELILSDVF